MSNLIYPDSTPHPWQRSPVGQWSLLGLWLLGSGATLVIPTPSAAASPAGLQVTVTLAQDGEAQPDAGLTLREALLLMDGSLPLERLSPQERQLVEKIPDSTPPDCLQPSPRTDNDLPHP
ncbi:hypothetical protein [Neosynechococcus sphagnicola]|uniref:hypothetical protein n=1 Tax=Neosynechococcus sphagnicola TaxID=1501145 RepID=UPI00068B5DA7|nr:hypothetical protein [Neosynechococcus sphagnicola]